MTSGSQPETPAAASAKTTFFRQSGWMIMSAVGSGVFMFAVHFFSKRIPETEYSILGTLLAMLNCMTIPSAPLQLVFAQQAAAAVTPQQKRQLSSTTRSILVGILIIWLLAGLVIWFGQERIVTQLQFSNPMALWLTLLCGLGALLTPLFSGILQGQQNFLWLGTSQIVSGAGRFFGVAVIVLIFYGHATGIILGALIGVSLALIICIWQTRSVWMGPGERFDLPGWLKQVVPLALGFGACQFLFSADPLFVQNYFPKEKTYPYMAAGTLCRALILFTGPVVLVMFPKIVRSAATKEKSNVLGLTLITTAIMSLGGAASLAFVAPVLLKVVFKESFLAAAPLLPWFALAMVPLTLGNVLVNHLLARKCFLVVPWLVVIGVGYGAALTQFHSTFLTVITVLGLANLLVLGVGAYFTWLHPSCRDNAQAA